MITRCHQNMEKMSLAFKENLLFQVENQFKKMTEQ